MLASSKQRGPGCDTSPPHLPYTLVSRQEVVKLENYASGGCRLVWCDSCQSFMSVFQSILN